MAKTRTEVVHVRLSSEEKRMAEQLAEDEDFTISLLVRRLIKKAHAERFGKKKR